MINYILIYRGDKAATYIGGPYGYITTVSRGIEG